MEALSALLPIAIPLAASVLGYLGKPRWTRIVAALAIVGPIVAMTVWLAMAAPSEHMTFWQAWAIILMMMAMGYAWILPFALFAYFLGWLARGIVARLNPAG